MPLALESIMEVPKENLSAYAQALAPEDVAQLVGWLGLKEDNMWYRAFLLLKEKSCKGQDVYPYFDTFVGKLGSDNSYQRSLGVMLIAENVRWDTAGKMQNILPVYLQILHDEKPIIVRQLIGSLGIIVKTAPVYSKDIAEALLPLISQRFGKP